MNAVIEKPKPVAAPAPTKKPQRMKTLVVAQQKGGVGKTTLARHLIFYGAEQGMRVLALDLDIQGNLTKTMRHLAGIEEGKPLPPNAMTAGGLFEGRAGTDGRVIPVAGAHVRFIASDSAIVNVERMEVEDAVKAIREAFAAIAGDFDLCVIDTGPAITNLLVAALAVADFAIAPCKPDSDAVDGLGTFFTNIKRVKLGTGTVANARLAPLGVLPNLVAKGRAYHAGYIADMRARLGTLVLPIVVHDRAAIDLAKERPVWATNRGVGRSAAAQEMRNACQYVMKRMGV